MRKRQLQKQASVDRVSKCEKYKAKAYDKIRDLRTVMSLLAKTKSIKICATITAMPIPQPHMLSLNKNLYAESFPIVSIA